jgi:hypothetical protein
MKIIEDAIFAIFSELRCEYIVDGFIMIELSLNRIRLPVTNKSIVIENFILDAGLYL